MAPTNRKEKQMQHNDTPTDRLVMELESVASSLMVQKLGGEWITTAFVSKDHTGPHVQGLRQNLPSVYIEGRGPTMAASVDDVLGKIAQAAPQTMAVPA